MMLYLPGQGWAKQAAVSYSHISKGYHLAECLHLPLGQVALDKTTNLVHFADFDKVIVSGPPNLGWHLAKWSVGEGTCPGAWESLVQVQASTWLSARVVTHPSNILDCILLHN